MKFLKPLIIATVIGLASLSGTGCTSITRVPTTKPELQLPNIPPLSLNEVDWIVVTKDNVDKVLEDLKRQGKPVVLYAIDNDNYIKHEDNMEQVQGRIIVLMRTLKEVLDYYKPDETPNE